MQPLPIDSLLPAVLASLRSRPTLVVEAPPGAGKTTRIPRALLDAGLAESGEIVVLEPRRLAARLAASRVADELHERVGETIGYQVRFEDVSSTRTRIRFVTEGVLVRKLLTRPDLRDVSTVVLDEFHERHLQGDIALALVERLRRGLRPDLRLIVMSATLAVEPLAEFLGAPVLRSEGRLFDVAIDYLPAPDDRPLGLQVASALRRLLANGLNGDVLVFLPGAAEIRRAREACEKLAQDAELAVLPLHGDLPQQEQDRAVRPAGKRKVILATNVAESSITIDGVVAVVDSGLARVASQAPWSGLPRLGIDRISRASARQRAGRAGRTAPGQCMRLYTRADFESRSDHDTPEIRRVDLAQTLLEIAALGARHDDIPWLEPPPPPHVRAAEDLLQRLGAIDSAARPTDTGRAMLHFAVHPRIARVLVEASKRGVAEDACIAAAILSEGDIRASSRARFGSSSRADEPTERSDMDALVDLFREAQQARFSNGAIRAAGLDPGATHAAARAASQLTRLCARRGDSLRPIDGEIGLSLALLAGYPDRVAKRVRAQGRQVALAGGGVAELAASSVVREAPWLIAIEAEERRQAGQPSGPRGPASGPGGAGIIVWLACAIEPEWLLDLFPEQIRERRIVRWNAQAERVEAREVMAWEQLVLDETECEPTPAEAERVLVEAAQAAGPGAFAGEGALERWTARVRFAKTLDASIHAPDDQDVRRALARLCEGRRSFGELRTAGLLPYLRSDLGNRANDIDRLAPERVTLAGGRSVLVRYESGKPPSIASRLQDFFGMRDGPRLGRGVPLVLELLAPNGRAVQVTADLAGFWQREYPGVRRALMRRYPKHAWPENPT